MTLSARLVFIVALILQLPLPCTALPLKPIKSISLDRVSNILERAGNGVADPFGTLNASLRVGANNPDPQCNSDIPLTRAMALSGTGIGTEEENVFLDSDHGFFKKALGWKDDMIEKSRKETLEHFKTQLGVDATDAQVDESTNIYVSPSTGLQMYPMMYNFDFIKLADSDELVPCANTTAVIGGWLAEGVDLTYKGPFSMGRPVLVPGRSHLFVLFIAFAPGKPFSTKLEWKATSPFASPTNVYGVVGDMKTIGDSHEKLSGIIHGAFLVQVIDGEPRAEVRLLLQWLS